MTVQDLMHWRDLGGDIGNHTWDHPCLDRCEPADQADQIDRAAEWLDAHGLWERRTFAYPNGDRTPEAEHHLAATGHELVALFDHHLASRRSGPMRVSRLRLDAAALPVRTAAVSSGWHSGLFAARGGADAAGRAHQGLTGSDLRASRRSASRSRAASTRPAVPRATRTDRSSTTSAPNRSL